MKTRPHRPATQLINCPCWLRNIMAWWALGILLNAEMVNGASFTPLLSLPAPRISSSSTAYAEPKYAVTNLFDGNPATDYAGRETGTNTTVDFDFGAVVSIAAFRHLERDDPATIVASELDFFDEANHLVKTIPVKHVNRAGGETFQIFSTPVPARHVKWRVTKIDKDYLASVGGAEISFYGSGAVEQRASHDQLDARVLRDLEASGVNGMQSVKVTVNHWYAEPVAATLKVGSGESLALTLQPGRNQVTFKLPGATAATNEHLVLEEDGMMAAKTEFVRQPARPLTIYLLPHSHTDIGFTEIQTAVAKKQVNNLREGIAAARRTANYPEGARFVWNVEVVWAADLYLRQMSEAQRQEFVEAVKKGWVGLNGMYLNELTGLCRPEELLRLFRFGTKLGEECGVPVDAAMISDVPGNTWGTVTAMSQAGIKYLSSAPNYFDRIGDILVENQNKPFYWVSPSGKEKTLVWIPLKGYALSHTIGALSAEFVSTYEAELESEKYPYDIAYLRWAGHGDNGPPDPEICEFVKGWNAAHVWPKFIIATTHDAFSAFEKHYGDKLPTKRGDWTPYWEDGAGSSALETAMSPANADRLTQAETLWAMLNPARYPAADFDEVWRDVLLYSEHTWGADCSISAPESQKTKEQWAIKRAYATHADERSRVLLANALKETGTFDPAAAQVDVFNTSSWPRTDLVTLSREQSAKGDGVSDKDGTMVPSQRLLSGELVFLAREVPPFASRRYTVSAGAPGVAEGMIARDNVLDNGIIRLEVDPKTGGITRLEAKGIAGNLVDSASQEELNEYLFLPGDKLADLEYSGPVKISVKEKGPLVAALVIESEAPGCRKLTREVRLAAGADYVELINNVDKLANREGKESVNFAFPFNVPDGVLKLDVPFGEMRTDTDQIPGACKNWFTVNRWADVANADFGITWVSLDAPLIEVGGLTARLLNSQTNPDVWRKKVERTQKFYSWVMNNHWGTNYRRYQEGPAIFRYILRPHKRSSSGDISRFALGFSQPLLAKTAGGRSPETPLLRVSAADVLVPILKPSDDGKAWIVRLFGASSEEHSVQLEWGERKPQAIFLSDTSETAREKINGPVSVPGFGLVTLRAEF